LAADKAAPDSQDAPPPCRITALRRRLAALREGKQPARQNGGDKDECVWPRNLNDEQEEAGQGDSGTREAGRE